MAIKKNVEVKRVATHLASSSVSGVLQSFFVNVFLPILPGLLLAAAPKIATSPKLQTVLKQVKQVLDQLIGED